MTNAIMALMYIVSVTTFHRNYTQKIICIQIFIILLILVVD